MTLFDTLLNGLGKHGGLPYGLLLQDAPNPPEATDFLDTLRKLLAGATRSQGIPKTTAGIAFYYEGQAIDGSSGVPVSAKGLAEVPADLIEGTEAEAAEDSAAASLTMAENVIPEETSMELMAFLKQITGLAAFGRTGEGKKSGLEKAPDTAGQTPLFFMPLGSAAVREVSATEGAERTGASKETAKSTLRGFLVNIFPVEMEIREEATEAPVGVASQKTGKKSLAYSGKPVPAGNEEGREPSGDVRTTKEELPDMTSQMTVFLRMPVILALVRTEPAQTEALAAFGQEQERPDASGSDGADKSLTATSNQGISLSPSPGLPGRMPLLTGKIVEPRQAANPSENAVANGPFPAADPPKAADYGTGPAERIPLPGNPATPSVRNVDNPSVSQGAQAAAGFFKPVEEERERKEQGTAYFKSAAIAENSNMTAVDGDSIFPPGIRAFITTRTVPASPAVKETPKPLFVLVPSDRVAVDAKWATEEIAPAIAEKAMNDRGVKTQGNNGYKALFLMASEAGSTQVMFVVEDAGREMMAAQSTKPLFSREQAVERPAISASDLEKISPPMAEMFRKATGMTPEIIHVKPGSLEVGVMPGEHAAASVTPAEGPAATIQGSPVVVDAAAPQTGASWVTVRATSPVVSIPGTRAEEQSGMAGSFPETAGSRPTFADPARPTAGAIVNRGEHAKTDGAPTHSAIGGNPHSEAMKASFDVSREQAAIQGTRTEPDAAAAATLITGDVTAKVMARPSGFTVTGKAVKSPLLNTQADGAHAAGAVGVNPRAEETKVTVDVPEPISVKAGNAQSDPPETSLSAGNVKTTEETVARDVQNTPARPDNTPVREQALWAQAKSTTGRRSGMPGEARIAPEKAMAAAGTPGHKAAGPVGTPGVSSTWAGSTPAGEKEEQKIQPDKSQTAQVKVVTPEGATGKAPGTTQARKISEPGRTETEAKARENTLSHSQAHEETSPVTTRPDTAKVVENILRSYRNRDLPGRGTQAGVAGSEGKPALTPKSRVRAEESPAGRETNPTGDKTSVPGTTAKTDGIAGSRPTEPVLTETPKTRVRTEAGAGQKTTVHGKEPLPADDTVSRTGTAQAADNGNGTDREDNAYYAARGRSEYAAAIEGEERDSADMLDKPAEKGHADPMERILTGEPKQPEAKHTQAEAAPKSFEARFEAAMNKVNEVMERFAKERPPSSMVVRVNVGEGDSSFVLRLRNDGQTVVAEIRTSDSGLTSLLNNMKDQVVKNLEMKDVRVSVFVNPDGQQDRQQGREQHQSRRQGKETFTAFEELLEEIS
jgi:hypothetical protein